MRVLMAQPHDRDTTLGSPKHFLRLGAALRARGHAVDYLFVSDLPTPLRRQRLLYLTFPLVVLAAAMRGSYDVLHVASGDALLAAAIRQRSRRSRPPVVNHVLGVEHIDWAASRRAWRAGEVQLSLRHRLWFGSVRLSQVRASARLSAAVMCSCEQDKSYMVGNGWRSASDIAIVPPGVDDVYLSGAPACLDSSTVLFLGTWIARKGVQDLAAAFAQVLSRLPAARLVVAGAHTAAGTVLETFPKEARRAIRVAPPCSENELLALMRESAVMVLPSVYEGFGMAFAEGMGAGLPVVGTPTGGMADWIDSRVNGMLVPHHDSRALGEALVEVLQDDDYRRRLGRAARETAGQLTWERAAESTEAVYEKCMQKAWP
jgi:glycosyltransferase involved in cell wall biosynthesis